MTNCYKVNKFYLFDMFIMVNQLVDNMVNSQIMIAFCPRVRN